MFKPSFILSTLLVSLALPAFARAETLASVLATRPEFSLLNQAVFTAGLTSEIANLKNAVVFAPTNAAFENLQVVTYRSLFENPARLRTLLLNHIVPESLNEQALIQRRNVTALGGIALVIGAVLQGGETFAYGSISPDCDGDGKLDMFERRAGSQVTTKDLMLDNGVIVQVLDQTQSRGTTFRGMGLPLGGSQVLTTNCD